MKGLVPYALSPWERRYELSGHMSLLADEDSFYSLVDLNDLPGPKGRRLYRLASKQLKDGDNKAAIASLAEAAALLKVARMDMSVAHAALALSELIVEDDPERAERLVSDSLPLLGNDPIHNGMRRQGEHILERAAQRKVEDG